MGSTSRHWIHDAILYQIYPRSFYDSNGDGVGDLSGIIEKLDYFSGTKNSLGVNTIWISPIYPSPMHDFGYDVSDYCGVDPLFGSIDDFTELIAAAHKRKIKVLLDFVPSHTSLEHPWFIESKSSRDNPKRDWYVWRDPKPDGSPPNNWYSNFSKDGKNPESAWKFDETTGQYYLHSFLEEQPDLNWDNPHVREAQKNNMRFWLELGVDGFRVDWVPTMSKDPEFRDEVPDPLYDPEENDPHQILTRQYRQNGPYLYDYLSELADLLLTYKDKFMITESYPIKVRKAAPYMDFYKRVAPLVSAPMNFALLYTKGKAAKFKAVIDRYQKHLEPDFVPIYSIGNHDQSRIASRFGLDKARTLAMMSLTLPGVPLIYNGDEIGMHDVVIPIDRIQDPNGKFDLEGKGSRDLARTPFQWNDQTHAGFTQGDTEPWLPVADDYATNNVAAQQKEPTSMFHLYKRLIAERKKHPGLTDGDYSPIDIDRNVFAYTRTLEGDNQDFGVLLNFSSKELKVKVPKTLRGVVNISTDARKAIEAAGTQKVGKHITLAPHEGLLIALG